MNSQEYRDALAQLGISQAEASRILDVDARTGRRWALGETADIPGPVALIVRLWLARPELVDVARRIANADSACPPAA